jgi:isoquinoline 1-oxidoreductase alpha subunit
MSACHLLKQHPKPTDAQIDAAMAGNLCRCATYTRIRAGIHRAAEIASNGKVKK